jgi:hypothetical protein
MVLTPLLAVVAMTTLSTGRLVPDHLVVGMLLVSPVEPQMATTGYRFLRYHSGGRADRKEGPPVLRLRARGPMAIASTVIVSLSGIVLLLEGPNARGDLLLIHKARFVLWLAVAALHIVGQLGHPARFASAPAETERVARTRGRMVLLVPERVVGLAIIVFAIPDFAARTSPGLASHLGDH